MEPMDIETAAIACQAVAGITQTAHIVALLCRGVELEKAKRIVQAQIEDTAKETAPELIELLKMPGKRIATADMKAILLRSLKLAADWLENGPPPERPFYEDPDGYHRHRCDKCLYVWQHENSDGTPSGSRSKAREDAHKCPSCGKKAQESFIGFAVYDGPLPPVTTTRK